MTRRSQSRPRRSRSRRPRQRSPSPIPRTRRCHRSRSPPTHRRHGSPPPPSTPTQTTNLPPLPRLRRRHPTPAPARRPDPRDHAASLGDDQLVNAHPDPTDHQPPSLHLGLSHTNPSTDHANQINGDHTLLTHHPTYPQIQHHAALDSTPDQRSP